MTGVGQNRQADRLRRPKGRRSAPGRTCSPPFETTGRSCWPSPEEACRWPPRWPVPSGRRSTSSWCASSAYLSSPSSDSGPSARVASACIDSDLVRRVGLTERDIAQVEADERRELDPPGHDGIGPAGRPSPSRGAR